MVKDGRMHGVIRDQELQDIIKTRQKLENLTFEELIEKYLTFPENASDRIHHDYVEIESLLVKVYGKKKLQILMELLWILIINCARDNYDIEKLLHNINADIELGTYKKR